MLKPSKTYKLRASGISEHAIYFTVVGETVPEAFFINSKEMESFQWVTALMTSYSRQVKAGVAIDDVIKDMKETFDPNGAYIIKWDGANKEIHSVVHHLGLLLERHVETTGDEDE